MKKLLVCVAALGMLFTSCMRDETRLDEGSIVTFKISAPAVSTRAAIEDTYGTGVAADDLHWAIFEADENGAAVGDAIFEKVEEGFFADGVLENTFNVRLVKGKSYVGMFWAQANGAPYTVAWPEVTMGDVNSNDEDLDAFFNIHDFSITAGQETGEQKVELRRPFAQLNVAIPATDLAAAKAAGFELAKTGVTLNVAKSLNLVTGKVGTTEDVTYTLANIPSDVTATLEGTEYQLISFNYVLVDGDAWTTESDEGQELKDVTFNYGTADETLSQTFSNIAIERNHRTYIVGSLLSETVDFRVIILPDWEDPYYLHNQEAGSITMVAEQTAINKAAMGSATLTWNAVEGAEYYGVEYKGEELDQVLPDGTTRADEEATAPATVSYTVPEGTVTDATASFTIKAYNENDKVIARVVTEPVAVFSLANVPEPAVYVADGKLIVENKELKGTEAVKSNLDLNGVLLEAEVYFYKDGATTPTYTAKGSYIDTYPTANLPLSIEEKKIKNNVAGSYYTWKWDGATTATTALPAFEKGTYTIKYKAGYYPVVNASFDRTPNDRIIVTDPSDILAEMQYREGSSDFKLTIVEGTTPEAVAEGYQGATVTWPAVDGAASYQVFVGATKVADATTNEATVTGLTDTNKYKFIVKSLDANGNVFATSVESNEIEVWTLYNTPAPVVTFTDGKLVATNLVDVSGVALKMVVNFTKEGESEPAYSAYSEHYFNSTSDIRINIDTDQKFKFVDFDTFTKWTWNGSTNKDEATDAAQTFAPGKYNISYVAQYYPIVGGIWRDASKNPVDTKEAASANGRITYPAATSVLEVETPYEGTAGAVEVGFNAEAMAAADILNISWNPIAGATYEVFVNSSLVGETTDASYAYEAKALGDYNIEVKVKNTELSATASAKVEYLFAAFWTAPKFSFTGKRLMVTELMNIDNATHFGYAYGGMANTASGKSTIEIYKDGTLLYTLTNGTAQSNLNSWAGWKRWAFNAQDNRQDWVWTKPDGTIISVDPNDATRLEADVPEGTLTAGNYTLKWTIGYVVTKNTYWSDGTNNQMTTKEGASRMYFDGGLNDVYGVGGQVATVSKTGETTLTVQ